MKTKYHYGWLIAFAGMLSIMACLGFARFVIGMILPSMSDNLKLNYSEMGLLSTGNFLGYLLSVLFAGKVISSFGPRLIIFAALTLSWLSMIVISQVSSFLLIMIMFFFTGVGSGLANVAIMSLVSRWFAKENRGKASGLIVIGSGFAIILSGWFIPYINYIYGYEGWRINWLVSAIIITTISLITFAIIRNNPEELGLRPLGFDPNSDLNKVKRQDFLPFSYISKILLHLGMIYLLFGFSYVIFITFIVTAMIQEYGFSEMSAGKFWSWVGLASLISGPLFGAISDKLGRNKGLIIVFFIQMIAYLLVASKFGGLYLYLAIVFFGITAWSIPSIMAATVGDYFGPIHSPSAFGYITFIFGLGQISGPIIAGIVAQNTGSFTISFVISALSALSAIILSAFLKRPKTVSV
ncbi:MAG: MFS transporter [Thermodesulfovibrionales bacterium]|nr:MFS transporter [Thermodesulfovibrionales bacterium]